MRIKQFLVGSIMLLSLTLTSSMAAADDRYTIHEWGTFTVLQNEQGDCLPGVNVNEERLPEFVHRLWAGAARMGGSRGTVTQFRSKGIPSRFVSATMRMETPIIYIYPPKGQQAGPLDVSVRFHGGWISEWYPEAQVLAPGLQDRNKFLGKLAANNTGEISWEGVRFGVEGEAPETKHHVWLAPRATTAPLLTSKAGEQESYLFYRGIAALEAPVRVIRDSDRNELAVKAHDVRGSSPDEMRHFWLVDVRPDGTVAYHQFQPTDEQQQSGTFATLPATFERSDYDQVHLAKLRSSMKEVLIEEGLYADEAEAMLRTWELSYFKSSGLRLFFTLPRTWTDNVLPLSLSREAHVERVMIGRVEIITARQRKLLETLRQTEIASPSWLWGQLETMTPEQQQEFWKHPDATYFPFKELGIEVPRDYQIYIDLGRFRDALVLNASKTEEEGNIRKFVQQYRLSDDAYMVQFR